MRLSLAVVLLAFPFFSSAGCDLYGGDDDPCTYPAEGERGASQPAIGLRNPQTGQCEYYGGGPYPCDPQCGPCPDYAEPAQPSWGLCESACTGLDESSCLSQSGCRGIYAEGPEDLVYLACWATDMSGPIQGGSCEELDAFACSRHDDCAAVHQSNCDFADGAGDAAGCEPTQFSRCTDERTYCSSDDQCGEGTRCNAGEVCLPNPSCEEGGACDAACYGYCVPDDQPDTGTCYGDVFCESLPPECPDGTMPGIKNGCWTGYCIPIEDCESQPACGAITEEASCVARPDCSALYEGIDCVCDESGCACAEWVFERCE